jgi:hypothetical protein
MTVESNMPPVTEDQTPPLPPSGTPPRTERGARLRRLALDPVLSAGQVLWQRAKALRAHPTVVNTYTRVRPYAVPLCLILILLLGAIFRFTGVNWDMDQHFHPDERFIWMVELSLGIPKSVGEYFNSATSPLNPYNHGGSFVYGTLPLFLVKFVGQILKVGGDSIHLLGRVLAGLFDLVTVVLMFLIGRKLYSTRIGLLAAFLSACLVISIQQAHFFTMDSFAATFVAATFYSALWVAERGKWSDFVAMGASFGAAVACRINVAIVGLVMGLAWLLRLYSVLTAPAPAPQPTPVRAPAVVPPPRAEEVAAGAQAPGRLGWERSFGGVRIALRVNSYANRSEAAPPLAVAAAAGSVASPVAATLPREVEPPANTAVEAVLPAQLELPVASALQKRHWLDISSAVAVRGAVCLLVAFLVFRMAQPYTFQGPGFFGLKLSTNWLNDMRNWSPILSGKADSYPSHQWASRLPVVYTWSNMVLWLVGLPLGLVGTAGWAFAWYELLRKRMLQHLLLLAWTTVSFLYHSTQFIKNPRYLVPMYPFLTLLAAYLLAYLWKRVRSIPWEGVQSIYRFR